MKYFFAIFFLVLIGFIGTTLVMQPSFGFECLDDGTVWRIENTPIIFTGKLVSADSVSDSQHVVTFEVTTKWRGDDFAKGQQVDIKMPSLLVDDFIFEEENQKHYLVYAEYDSDNNTDDQQIQFSLSSCGDSLKPIERSKGNLMLMLDRGMASDNLPEIIHVFHDNSQEKGMEPEDLVQMSIEILNPGKPKAVTVVLLDPNNDVMFEEHLLTDIQGKAQYQYTILDDAKPGNYKIRAHTSQDVVHLQNDFSYIVNEPGTCEQGMYRHIGVCKKPEDFCKSSPGASCEFNYSQGTCECVSTGDCLIATASYGSELAPQVQMLREIRDNMLLNTESGKIFMNGFNSVYYSFSPHIAQLENENPIFKEAVKLFITPMITTLSIMTLADENSEFQVITLGISTIGLVVGMYVVAPVILVWKVRKRK